jgi:hypothetical protein
MKRLLGILTAFVLLAGIPIHAFAAPASTDPTDRVGIHDVLVVGAPPFTPLRATSAPTSYAGKNSNPLVCDSGKARFTHERIKCLVKTTSTGTDNCTK